MFKKAQRVATSEEAYALLTRGLGNVPSPVKAPKAKTPEQNFKRGFEQFDMNRAQKRKYQSIHFLSYLMELCIFNPDVFGSSGDEMSNCKQIKECFADYAERFIQEVKYINGVPGVYGGNLIRVFVAAQNDVSVIGEILQDETVYRYIFTESVAEGLEEIIRLAGIMTRMKFIAYYQVYESTRAVADFAITREINNEFVKGGAENLAKVGEEMVAKHSPFHVNLTTFIAKAQAEVIDREEQLRAGMQIAQVARSLFLTVKKDQNSFSYINEHDFGDYDAGVNYLFGLSLEGTHQMFILSPEADLTALEALPFELGHLLTQKWADIKIKLTAPTMFPTFN